MLKPVAIRYLLGKRYKADAFTGHVQSQKAPLKAWKPDYMQAQYADEASAEEVLKAGRNRFKKD
jgi:hypothetical protein